MNNTMLSDRIEKFILEMLDKETNDQVLLKRKDVADLLECAPSQVTYVINTRFSSDDRFVVESRRGSGGYIKISLRSQNPPPRRAPASSTTSSAPNREEKSSGKSSPKENPNSTEAIENGLDGYYRMLVDYDIISNQEYRLIYAMTHTMLEYCPESHRREAAKTMIHRIEWALKGE
ncbi:CtsR family transcriptional regulator [uncultured Dialister sp.]|uniref:CtsR family transcriptional regulator n=1 Tax=uncultured Dialister sp. TaxID=278064 RepID=UPI0025E1F51B|nr:CtsR family transcriptional regulator [uncultured Dialister sp.]